MGKMKALTLAAALFLAVPRVRAQSSLYLGVKGGISIPNLSAGGDNPVSKGYASILGPYFGVFAERDLSKRFSLQVELNYDAQGGKKNGVQAIPSSQFVQYFPPGYVPPPYFYATFSSTARLNYLELPILVKYHVPIGKDWKFTVNLGPYMGYVLHAKDVTKDTSTIYFDPQKTQPLPVGPQDFGGTQDLTDQVHRFNFGIQGGIGLEYACGHGRWYLNVGGNYGLLNIQKYAEDGKNNTGAATFAVGYAMKLH
jgi:hypothetical protein